MHRRPIQFDQGRALRWRCPRSPVMQHLQTLDAAPATSQARLVERTPSRHWSAQSTALHAHWTTLSQSDGRPWDAFDPLQWTGLLPNIWLLDVQQKPFRLKFRLVGTRIVEQIHADPTGRWLDEALPHLVDNVDFIERYRMAAIEGVPVWTIGPADIRPENPIRAIENLILPFTVVDTKQPLLLRV